MTNTKWPRPRYAATSVLPMLPFLRLQHAARRLRRAPGFALSAALTLALGIGGTTAVFTVVNGVLLQPLPYPHAEQLVDLSHTLTVSGISRVDQSDATYLLYRRENRVFTDVGVYRSAAVNLGAVSGHGGAETAAGMEPERVQAAVATAGVFGVLHASPQRGRVLTDADGQPGAPPVVLIGQGLWRRKFGGDPSLVGQRIAIDGVERTVVGIMPAGFGFPSPNTELWFPPAIDPAHTASAAFDYRGIARLRAGVSLAAATADLQRLLPQVPEVYPGRLTGGAIAATHMRAVVRSLRDVVVGNVGRVLWVVLGAVGGLLLIACANVANLFLARGEGRHRELALRRALGASRGALLADFLSESVILAAIGAALGLAGAAAGVQLLQSTNLAGSIPRLGGVHVDGLVVAVTVCTAALAAIIVSAVPVMRAGRASLSHVLIASGSAAGAGRGRSRARRALVVVQVALALVLLAGAGLFARSFARLRAVDPGFDAGHALAFRVALPAATYPTTDASARAVVRTLDALRALPGVEAAGAVTKLPLDDESREDSAVYVYDHPLAMGGGIPDIHQIVFATPAYFQAMGIPLIAGRIFARPDAGGGFANPPREVIVSKAFADRYWNGQSAIGKRVRMNRTDPWSTIVGVVGSVRDEALDKAPADAVYAPLVTIGAAGMPWTPRNLAFVVRGAGDPTRLAAPVRRTVTALLPTVPLYHVIPVSALLSQAAARTTFTLLLLGIASIVAMVIGAMGIYGVISYLVGLRTREIGVRLALGARPADVRRLVARHALTDAFIGVVIGLIGAVLLTGVLSALLFGVSPADPLALGAAAAILLLTALAASWLPARRAAALDPASALRVD